MSRKPLLTVRELCVLAMAATILVVLQVALAALPNIEVVSLLVVVFTLTCGWRSILSIYTFVAVEGTIYGFGMWWYSYLYIWTVLWAVTLAFKNVRSLPFWTLVLGLYGLGFGTLTTVPHLFVGDLPFALSYWINNIPFDILHAIGNTGAAIVLFKPCLYVMEKVVKCMGGYHPPE